MNKLCCLLNPHGICEGCGAKWCQPCSDEYNWSIGNDHSIWSNSGYWKCPVAKKVTVARHLTYHGWNFTPYE